MRTRIVFESGDAVEVIKGSYKGRVGIITDGEDEFGEGEVTIDEISEEECFDITEIKYISKSEYNKKIKDQPILRVGSLDRTIQFTNNSFKVGCQTMTKADAKKVAAFLNKFAK